MTREEKIMSRLHEHYDESLKYFKEEQIVGCYDEKGRKQKVI